MLDANSLEFSALILRLVPYRDRDFVLTLLSEAHGRLSCIIHSARSSKKAIPEPLEIGRCNAKSGRGSLLVLSYYKPSNVFPGLRLNLGRYTAACVWAESLEHLTVEGSDDGHVIFNLASAALQDLERQPDARSSLRCLCEHLDNLLEVSGFGALREKPAGSKKVALQTARIAEVSGRPLKSLSALEEIIRCLPQSDLPTAIGE